MITVPVLGFQLQDVIAVAIVATVITFAVAYFYILKDFDSNIRLGTSARLATYSGLGTYAATRWGLRPAWAR